MRLGGYYEVTFEHGGQTSESARAQGMEGGLTQPGPTDELFTGIAANTPTLAFCDGEEDDLQGRFDRPRVLSWVCVGAGLAAKAASVTQPPPTAASGGWTPPAGDSDRQTRKITIVPKSMQRTNGAGRLINDIGLLHCIDV